MWLQLKLVLFALTLCRGQKVDPTTEILDTLFRNIGFTPSCVSQSLAQCEDNQSSSLLQEIQAQLKQIIDSNKELKSDIENLKSVSQESKLDFKKWKIVVEESKLDCKELKSDIENLKSVNQESKLDFKELKIVVEESKLDFKELKTVVEESNLVAEKIKSVVEDSNSFIKEWKSDEEEMKSVIEESKTVVEESNLVVEKIKSVVKDSNSEIKELKSDVKAVMKFNKMSARNCADLLKMGDTESGVRKVQMFPQRSCGNRFVPVFCDQTTDGGGWTVIQRRADLPQREDFYRGWVDYQLGFGNLAGEFWLGLDNIHALVNETQMELRVDLEDFDGEKRWAKYSLFHIEDSAGKYRLKIKDYQGDAGDEISNHNNLPFTTKDADHDIHTKLNCAEVRKGAWWYGSCSISNLNGVPLRGSYKNTPFWSDGIFWLGFRGFFYSLKSTQLSVRPRLQN